ncbi:MAG: protein O-mannosyl-transferase family, partial [Candidatus Muiribacteriaceae bacterium]
MLCAILFIPHINRNIDTGDGGEFILTASLLGNAHPSGYPLYNISAHLFHLLPFGNEAFKASLFSMTFLIACGFFVALIIEELSDDFVFAFTGGIACICGFTFLYSGLTQEAYTLMLFFLLGALYFYIRYLNTLNFDYAKACFFSVGLMTAVHITGVFYFIILFICILANRDGEDRIRKIITSFYFALPLVIYGFMFFRGDAVFSWGRVENIGDVYALISGSERDVGSRFFSLEPAQYLHQFSVY